jgi:hypothetical protein
MAGKRMLDGPDGGRSSMRILWTFVVVIVMVVWAIVSLYSMSIATLGYDLVTLLVLMSGGKVAQTMVESGKFSLNVGNK